MRDSSVVSNDGSNFQNPIYDEATPAKSKMVLEFKNPLFQETSGQLKN